MNISVAAKWCQFKFFTRRSVWAATNTLTIDNVQESNKQTVAAVCHHTLSCKNGEVETFTIQRATAVESV